MASIKQLSSKITYQNRWMTVHEDAVEFPDGMQGIYGYVHKPDFALIIPVLDEQLCLVEQYRYPIKARSLEFPQGTWDSQPDIAPEKLAIAELQEETGYTAGKMLHIGHQYIGPGMTSQGGNIFLATALTAGQTNYDPEEQDLKQHLVNIIDFEKMIVNGEIRDTQTIAAWALVKLKGLI